MIQRTIDLYKESFGGLSREVWLLAAVMFVNRCGMMVITFLTIYLTKELSFSVYQAGIVMSFFGLGSLTGSFIGGWLTDRIGYHRVMFWSLFLSGICLVAAMYLQTFLQFCIGFFIISTIGDSLRPANLTAVGIYSKEENRTRSLSLIRLAFNFGLGIGPALGGFVAMTYGYHYIFILDGFTCISAALLFSMALPYKAPTAKEKADRKTPSTSRSAYKDVFFLRYIFFIFLSMVTFMHLFTILPMYWEQHFHLNEAHVGFLLGLNGIIIGIIEMPVVYVVEKKYPLFPLIIFGTLLIGLSYLIFTMIDWWVGITVVSMLLITFGEIINFPFMNTVALNRAPADRRGEYMGLYGMSFSLALIIAPTFGGWIVRDYGWNTLWYILTGLSIIAILGFMSMQKTYEEEIAEKKEDEVDKVIKHLVTGDEE